MTINETVYAIDQAVVDFVETGIANGETDALDRIALRNLLLALIGKEDLDTQLAPSQTLPDRLDLLDRLVDWAAANGEIADYQYARETLEAQIMSLITPLPSVINKRFWELYEINPETATDYFYELSQNNDYIKTRSIAKNIAFAHRTDYGDLEITINLSKPEKDPKQIALAKHAPASAYPACQLCMENEGYAGRIDHPARANHRIVRMPLNGEKWGLQYSPYAYYEEHCIFLSEEHTPMKLNKHTFGKLLGIITQFPHYFVGSNADLPIVGGSILSHDHYQGGRHTFAMAEAPIELPFELDRFASVQAGIVKWPMSVIRLAGKDAEELAEAAEFILDAWRGYSDEAADILAATDGTPHNTITPIARMRDGLFELDLVLRNNRTSTEFPDGIFHPHPDVQNIKKENIGLIEVMGLAILPPRLKDELIAIENHLNGETAEIATYHKEWVAGLAETKDRSGADTADVVQQAVGAAFLRVLEDAGVFKRTPEGQQAFRRFIGKLH
ncbi:UDP-glucose--hexose-1-phosphate uridylyltransferase [Trichococcus ilyis]|uniref:Galactose-1-phosphate uridylyltransferase n=1 Tax=Trichococcus ilyis TaxID=640938 RepID=A0A143YND0_9LACT|nr:UDP-glucose--hexose-1-phosphate uridylyltransferase [Trichococcus ilyis]CZQ92581.1 galactose-1-phosphate uridyl transferase class ii [Trichococcus ilyis]SEI94840.1 UDPglucose--hexose-1-phosphate uridylyltransferase [Trichococcus ilyis]